VFGIIHYLDFFHRPMFEIKEEEKEVFNAKEI